MPRLKKSDYWLESARNNWPEAEEKRMDGNVLKFDRESVKRELKESRERHTKQVRSTLP